MALRRKREVEDPNNTWDMQLMVAVCSGDTSTADELLLKGAKIDHYAPAILNAFPAVARNAGPLGNLMAAQQSGRLGTTGQTGGDSLPIPTGNPGNSFENPVGSVNNAASSYRETREATLISATTQHFNPSILTFPRSSSGGGLFAGVGAPISIFAGAGVGGMFNQNVTAKGDRPSDDAAPNTTATTTTPQKGPSPTPGGIPGSAGAGGGVISAAQKLNIAGVDPDEPLAFDPSTHVKLTPFLAALLYLDLETATWVAQHGGNTNAQFNEGKNGTIFHFLVRVENAALLERVCSKINVIDDSGAFDINAKDATCGLTPVELALYLHRPEMARILLMFGAADPFHTLVDGRYTATQRACITGNVQMLQTYLSAGDNIRQKDPISGETLFHLGLLHPPIIDYLVEVCSSLTAGGGAASSPTSPPGTSAGVAAAASATSRARTGSAFSGSRPPSAGPATKSAQDVATTFNINTALNARGESPLVFTIRHLCNASPHLPGLNGAALSNAPPSTPSKPSEKKSNAAAGMLSSLTHPDPVAAAVAAGVVVAQDINQYVALGQPAMPASLGPLGGKAAVDFNSNIAQMALVALGVLPNNAQMAPLFNAGNGILSTSSPDQSSASVLLSSISLGVATPKSGLELVDYLISKGADPTGGAPDGSPLGQSPLMHAIIAYAPEVIKRLVIDLKVPLAARDCLGSTALHYAVNAHSKGTLGLLLHADPPADVNAQDRLGETALHRAAARGNVAAIDYLLQLPNTDVNLADALGRNPLHAAVAANQLGAVEVLLKRCSAETGSPPLEKGKKAPTKKGQLPEFTVPQRLQVDAEDSTPLRQTALQIAVQKRFFPIVSTILSTGLANAERPSSLMPQEGAGEVPEGDFTTAWRDVQHSGGTILHEAVLQQDVRLVKLLLASGANVLSRNFHDRTALHLACCVESQRGWAQQGTTKGSGGADEYNTVSLEIVAALLEQGATVVDQDAQSLTTPLHIACRTENVKLVRLLLERVVADANSTVPPPHTKALSAIGDTSDSGVTPSASVGVQRSSGFALDLAADGMPFATSEEKTNPLGSEASIVTAQEQIAQKQYARKLEHAVVGALVNAVSIQDAALQSPLHVAVTGNDGSCAARINKSMIELPSMVKVMGSEAIRHLPLIRNLNGSMDTTGGHGLTTDSAEASQLLPEDEPSSRRLQVLRAMVAAVESASNGNASKHLTSALFHVDFDGCTPLQRLCMASSSAQLASPETKDRYHYAQVALLEFVASLLSPQSLESVLWLTDSRGWTPAHAAVAFSGANQPFVTRLLQLYADAPQSPSSQPPIAKKTKTLSSCNSLQDVKDCFSAHIVNAGGIRSQQQAAEKKKRNIITFQDNNGRNLLLLSADYGRVELSRTLVRLFKSAKAAAV